MQAICSLEPSEPLVVFAKMKQECLHKLWLSAPEGRLSPWEQAKALALREASRMLHDGWDNLPWVCERLTKSGGGHPQPGSLHEFFSKVDADSDWFPGKHNGAKRGPTPQLTPHKRRCIAESAMAAKKYRKQEPCVAAVVQACPDATRNEKTGKPFDPKTIRKVFLEDCYDFDAAHPWRFQCPLQKVALPDGTKQHRLAMGKHLLRHGPAANWWAQHVVWFDPCSSIIPGSQNHYDRMRQACKGHKRYISDNAKMYSPNLRGSATAQKQKTWEGTRVNWVMVLARGVVHVEVMPEGWQVNGDGMATFVRQLPALLRKMLGNTPLPRMLFTDRGTGMYTPPGKVVAQFHRAVIDAGFKVFWGEDASVQSPDMGDVLLHETAVAWFRKRMRKEPPAGAPWEETQRDWGVRARRAVAAINENYKVSALCREFPQRLQALVDGEGERLPK